LVFSFAAFSDKMGRKIIFAAVHAKRSHKIAINSFGWFMTRLSVQDLSPNPRAAAPIFLIPASVKNVLHFGSNLQSK
jgi:hypothetical protein